VYTIVNGIKLCIRGLGFRENSIRILQEKGISWFWYKNFLAPFLFCKMSGYVAPRPPTQILEDFKMKRISSFFTIQVISVALAFGIAGCYTQLGSVRDGGGNTEEYQQPPDQGYYEAPYDSNATMTDNYYYYDNHLPSPYYRFAFSYYYPSYYWGWYNDPFYSDWYDPFSYNPWICGTPFITYGSPWWYYNQYGFGYPYYTGGYYSYYPRGYFGVSEGFHGTRNFGSTRGTTRASRSLGSTREMGYIPPPAIPVSTTTPAPAVNRGATPATTTTTRTGGTNRGDRTSPAAVGRGSGSSTGQSQGQSAGRTTGSRRSGTRSGSRQSVFPPHYVPPPATRESGSGNSGSTPSRDSGGQGRSRGGESHAPSTPQSAPSYSPPPSGGSRGSSSPSGSSGGGGRTGGSSRGGGRSGGGSRGGR
jgi:hypothetical protein